MKHDSIFTKEIVQLVHLSYHYCCLLINFMESLRFWQLSTHERDYRDLLAYKLNKWGINTKIVDMSEVESIR